jgi:very-short-patch-repair endonuclease
MEPLRTIWSVSTTQHGLVTSGQAREAGLSVDALLHLVRRGTLERITPCVLRVPGTAPTEAQRLLAAVLDGGPRAALSHTSALAHWGVRGFTGGPVHVTRHRDEGDRRARGTVLHEVRSLPAEGIRVLDGIPVVVPALALLQLAGMADCRLGRLARAIDAAWSDRLVSYAALKAWDERMSRQGRRGLRAYRALVEERGPAYTPPASNLEARFDHILREGGRPAMRRQVDTGDGARWVGRVDFRDERLPVIVEVQSERFHRGLTAEADDHRRIDRLRAAGFEVVEVTDVEVFHRPAEVLARVDAARARAARRAR